MLLFCVSGCIEADHTRKNCCDNLRHIFIFDILYDTIIQRFTEAEQKMQKLFQVKMQTIYNLS
jgi:predicted ATPase